MTGDHEIDWSKMESNCDCYLCQQLIPAGSNDWGFVWGSDGVYPDGASAMYACHECKAHWFQDAFGNRLDGLTSPAS